MLKYVNKVLDLNDEHKTRITKIINKNNKATIQKNIEYCLKLGIPKKNIALIFAHNPDLFLLNPNPDNNGSLQAKLNLFKEFKMDPKFVVMFYNDLLTVDLYENSNATKILRYLHTNLGLDEREMSKLLKKSPKILKQKFDDPSLDGFMAKLDYWKNIAHYAHTDLKKFIIRHPHFLSCSIDPNEPSSMPNKIQYLKDRFNINDYEVCGQIYSFPNFTGLDISEENPRNIDKKAKKLNNIGFDDQTIGKNLKALGAPLQKLKIRYIICKNYGMADSVFLNNKFMIHESKLYARARYIEENRCRHSLIYACEGEFMNATKTHISDIVEKYPLTREVALEEIERYNRKYPKDQIQLSQSELDLIVPKTYKKHEVELNG